MTKTNWRRKEEERKDGKTHFFSAGHWWRQRRRHQTCDLSDTHTHIEHITRSHADRYIKYYLDVWCEPGHTSHTHRQGNHSMVTAGDNGLTIAQLPRQRETKMGHLSFECFFFFLSWSRVRALTVSKWTEDESKVLPQTEIFTNSMSPHFWFLFSRKIRILATWSQDLETNQIIKAKLKRSETFCVKKHKLHRYCSCCALFLMLQKVIKPYLWKQYLSLSPQRGRCPWQRLTDILDSALLGDTLSTTTDWRTSNRLRLLLFLFLNESSLLFTWKVEASWPTLPHLLGYWQLRHTQSSVHPRV